MSDPHLTSNRYFRAAVLEALESVMPGGDAIEAAIQLQIEKLGTGELTTKGDVLGHDGSIVARLAVGTNGQVLTVASGDDLGLRWVTPTPPLTDHGALTGLADDDHTQYTLLAGRAGGQTINGGTVAGNALTLKGESTDTGFITVGDGLLTFTAPAGNNHKIIDYTSNQNTRRIEIGDFVGNQMMIRSSAVGAPANELHIRIQNTTVTQFSEGAVRFNVTTQHLDGTAGQPGIKWFSDLTTGIFRVTTGSIGFSLSGNERIRMVPTNLGQLMVGDEFTSLDTNRNIQCRTAPNFANGIKIVNTNVGIAAATGYSLQNGTGAADVASLTLFGSGFSGSGSGRGDHLGLSTSTPGGISIASSGNGGRIDFYPVSRRVLVLEDMVTGLVASTERIHVEMDLGDGGTVTFPTGAKALQRGVVIKPPTWDALGATVVAEGTTFTITGAPSPTGNLSITLALAMHVEAGKAKFSGAVEIAADGGLEFSGQTDGAGAGAGTLTNAPTAGDPSEWIPITNGGNARFIPAWA